MSEQKKVNKQKTKDVKVKNPKHLKSHELLTDSLKRKKVRIFLFKGLPVASRELIETDVSSKKLRLVRLFIDFMQLKDKVSIDMLTVKDNIEQIDIDLSLLEFFLRRHYDKWVVTRILTPIVERHDAGKIGDIIGSLTLEYHQYLDLVKFLEHLLKEPLKTDDFKM
jgi:hypothetical protein